GPPHHDGAQALAVLDTAGGIRRGPAVLAEWSGRQRCPREAGERGWGRLLAAAVGAWRKTDLAFSAGCTIFVPYRQGPTALAVGHREDAARLCIHMYVRGPMTGEITLFR